MTLSPFPEGNSFTTMNSPLASTILKQALSRVAFQPCPFTLSSNSLCRLTGARRALHIAARQVKRIHSSARKPQSSATGAVPLGDVSCPQNTPRPSSHQLRTLFVASAIPMLGFGFMDNFIMIQAGGYIDATLGVTMGLATLTAAAMGQVVSDVSGVVFGGTVERFLHRVKMIRSPGLSEAQRHLAVSRNVAMAGSVVGVIIGCMLGACSLLFIDLDAHERVKRASALHDVVTTMLSEDEIHCDECTIYLFKADIAPLHKETNAKGVCQMKLLGEAKDKPLAVTCAQKRCVVRGDNVMYVPVIKGDDMEAVLEFRRKQVSGESFSLEEERAARTLARHMAIFMDRLRSD